MEENLKTAAENGDINMIYISLSEDPYLLDHIDHVPFIHTSLHIAASSCHVQFAKEIMRLKPSFARKLNQEGEGRTPLHYVAEQGDVDLLIKLSSACPLSIEDVTVQNETALHNAVKNQRGLTALDISNPNNRQVRETLLPARALDAPGGVWQDDNNNTSTNNTQHNSSHHN
ncbi:hypothetical protein FEM48_Zijuj05G0172100 [Ziziphus jujuba var. spinosa]|uniref:Ankyrin repeat-containing protein BDA1-like n=1 Tax=Ziziphus jujuba var. spinosa TaxID=714518 RepID=A0A978VG33_ZIZJJ|nr:hypothetical protein FEM48_Zijuj05G0172100 [Ziziphus jujuba var. spinosa]